MRGLEIIDRHHRAGKILRPSEAPQQSIPGTGQCHIVYWAAVIGLRFAAVSPASQLLNLCSIMLPPETHEHVNEPSPPTLTRGDLRTDPVTRGPVARRWSNTRSDRSQEPEKKSRHTVSDSVVTAAGIVAVRRDMRLIGGVHPEKSRASSRHAAKRKRAAVSVEPKRRAPTRQIAANPAVVDRAAVADCQRGSPWHSAWLHGAGPPDVHVAPKSSEYE